jgi:pyruvate formate lyase activating enzyme
MIKEAMHYESLQDGKVICHLCSHNCKIAPSKYGICNVRENQNGELKTHVYGEVIAAHVDPIEKKPLYHFLPGSESFSIATAGCNFRCPFCQNWQISQLPRREKLKRTGDPFSPEDIVKAALRHGCQSISYTYTEPTIFYEYAYDTSKLGKENSLYNVFVTNGYMSAEALEDINPYLDACNVDLKSFRDEFYKEMCQARLQPVLDSIRRMKDLGIWVEITTLIVPDQNDDESELTQIARFIKSVDPDIPWHISRYHPDYQYHESDATPVESLRKAMMIGKNEGLKYIYIGNVLAESEDTRCPQCDKIVIQRKGFGLSAFHIEDSSCSYCGHPIAGIF